jgi:hypothetical protein
MVNSRLNAYTLNGSLGSDVRVTLNVTLSVAALPSAMLIHSAGGAV